MKNISWIAVLASLLVWSCSGPLPSGTGNRLGGGTDLGNGSDWIPGSERSHWFPRRGGEIVEYCVEVSSDFGKERDELAEMVAQAFQQWERYLRVKNLPTSYLSLATAYVGGCNRPVPLRFYFGAQGEGVAEAISGFRKPFGVAKFERERKRGFIWISEPSRYGHDLPSWSDPDFLLTELLHEIGHVYGNDHVAGTVMREHLAFELPTLPQEYLGKIDHDSELVPHDNEIWICDPTPIGSSTVKVFSDRFPGSASLSIYRVPDSKMVPMPLAPGAVWIPSFPSTLFLNLNGNGVSETFVSIGEEAVISHAEPRRSFLVIDSDFQWSAPVVNQSYLVSLVSERDGKTVRLMLAPQSNRNLEIFLQPDQIPLMSCPLRTVF